MTKPVKKLVSKSIQFPDKVVSEMDTLAKQVGFTHLQGGGMVGNIARMVVELVEFALSRKEEFMQWKMSGKK